MGLNGWVLIILLLVLFLSDELIAAKYQAFFLRTYQTNKVAHISSDVMPTRLYFS